MILSERQEKVLEFVKIAHGTQVRKYTGEPYWTHCLAVADIASKHHERVIEIALLHDVLEDTNYIVQDMLDLCYDGWTLYIKAQLSDLISIKELIDTTK